MSGWAIGFTIGIIVVIAVVALVVPILGLAHRIGKQALEINSSLRAAEDHTGGLSGLTTTIEHATVIIAGLGRGRAKLGG